MRAVHGGKGAQRLLPAARRLAGQAKQQTHVHVAQVELLQKEQGVLHLLATVGHAQRDQLAVDCAPDGQVHAVDAAARPVGQARRAHRERLHVDGDLGPRLDRQPAAQATHQVADLIGAHEARPTREAQRGDWPDAQPVVHRSQLGLHRVDVGRLGGTVGNVGLGDPERRADQRTGKGHVDDERLRRLKGLHAEKVVHGSSNLERAYV